MSRFDGWRHRLYVLIRGEAYADEIRREMRFHRELDALAHHGNALGNETYYREEVRRMTLWTVVDRIRQDAAYALRGLRRSPGFTAAVVLTLGLGIGVNAAMFSLLDRLFFDVPGGVAHPDQVRRLYFEFVNGAGSVGHLTSEDANYPQYRAFREALDPSVPMAAYAGPDSVLIRDGTARIPAYRTLVTPGFFDVLGVRPALGRFFAADEQDVAVPTPLIVLSDAVWRRAFNADPSAIGRTVLIGATRYTIIGVAHPEFTGIDVDVTDFWIPANNTTRSGGFAGEPWYRTFGTPWHLIARVPDAAAERRLLTVGTNAVRPVELRGLVYDPNISVLAGPIIEARGPRPNNKAITLATRIAAVTLIVLLIAFANVTNLLLLRAMRRQREIAVRRALGVSRARLVSQLTVESVLLALLGGAVAVTFATAASATLRRLFLPDVHWATDRIDARMMLAVFAVSVLIGLIGGFAPGFRAMKPDLADSLRSGTTGGMERVSRLRTALLGLQAALCAILLVGAGLFARSFDNVKSIGIGYDPANTFFANPTFDVPSAHTAEVNAAIPEVAKRLRAMNGVVAVGYAWSPPLGSASYGAFRLPGRDSADATFRRRSPASQSVSPGFFAASGLALLSGREFSDSDQPESAPVTIVSDALARAAWPNQSALGQCIITSKDGTCTTVVGVVADAHLFRVIERPTLQFYLPIAQTKESPRSLIVRTLPGREAGVIRATDQAMRTLVSDMLGLRIRTFDTAVEREMRPWRSGAQLFGALGMLALIVAGVGVYSVVAYGVNQRTHEMGVRLALGAQKKNIVDLVLRDGLRVVAIGAAAGIVAAIALGRVVSSLLFGVVPADPSTLIGAAMVLAVVGAVACVIPGWRAATLDPVSALRSD